MKRLLPRFATLAALIGCAGIVLYLYAPSLNFGFMYDDPFDLPRSTDRSYWSVLTDAGPSAYFRPFLLLIWRTSYDLFGYNNAPALHVLCIATHLANVGMVYLLGRRFADRPTGLLAAALFASFPLSYQAVANVSTYYHPLVAMFLLASVCLYLRWRDRGGALTIAASLVSGALAALTHENGVTVVALVAFAEALWLWRGGKRRPSRAVLAYFGLSVAYVILWALAPKWSRSWTIDLASIKLNTLYFAQGIDYPLSSEMAKLPILAGSSLALRILVPAAVMLLVLALLNLSARRGGLFAFALGIVAVGVLPTLLVLPHTYVVEGPRLFHVASIGIGLAWAGALTAPLKWRSRGLRLAAGSLGLAVAAFVLVQSAQYVLARNPVYEAGADVVRQIVVTATDRERPGRTYLNVPSWLAPREPDYLLGHTGVSMIPDYIGLGRVAYIVTGEQPDVASLTYEAGKSQWSQFYGPHGPVAGADEFERAYRRGGSVYFARYVPGRIALGYVGEIRQTAPAGSAALVEFDRRLRLISATSATSGQQVDVTLNWDVREASAKDETVFAHIYDGAGKLVAQADGYAFGDTFPISRWRPGDSIVDARQIELPAGVPSGDYKLAIGVYERASGARAAAVAPDGSRFRDDAAIVGTVTIR